MRLNTLVIFVIASVAHAGVLFGQCAVFTPGPYSASILGNVVVDNAPGSPDAELAAYDEDGVCLGKTGFVEHEGLTFFNLAIYGDDPLTIEDEGISVGESFLLEYSNTQTGQVILFDEGASFPGWSNMNGAPLPGWNNPFQTLHFSSDLTCPGDFNSSGAIEVSDLLDLLTVYGGICLGCREDLDGDGLVQVNDLLNLLTLYGSTC